MKKLIKGVRFVFSKLLLLLQKLFYFFKTCMQRIHRRKRYAIPFYSMVAYVVLVVLIIQFSGDSQFQKVIPNKRVNDVTAINPIHVNTEIQPTKVEDIVEAIKHSSGPISIGGGRYSMGGQIGFQNSLHIDMRKFNKVLSLDTIKKQVVVQSGIVWRDLQKVIDPKNLSIKIMQTYANFTVGGSVSVNCHGRYIGHGPIVSSVLEIKLVTASGEVLIANREQNSEVFFATVGGYGGIGVITEVTLQLDDNVKVERETMLVTVDEYNDFFNNNIRNNKDVVFQNGDLYPPNFDVINNVAWKKSDKELTDNLRITPEGENYWLESSFVELVSWGGFGKWLRQNAIDPFLYSSDAVVWRNKEASYDVRELEPQSRAKTTYVLQEYFIPVNNIKTFIPKMKAVFERHNVNVINVSLRHAHPDKETYLSWAEEEVFAFVIYYKQETDPSSRENVKAWTIEMTDAILSENGKWYLPYQPHATLQQFEKGFPNALRYFDLKNSLDSTHRFTNKLLDKYNPYIQDKIEKKRESIKGYYRDEGQTFLTVPEWYLVFNPKEYADYLETGKNPSDFPFYASISEYWTLYDRSMKLVSTAYDDNEEYNTMLQVIGVSITLEYTGKMLYENTVGKFFSWFDNGTRSEEERTIIQAQRAYSDFIYNTAWYEFQFMPWVKKVWNTSNTSESNWFRKIERILFFTIEFTFKAAYATLIEWTANASYEPPVTEIYLLASNIDTVNPSSKFKIIERGEDKSIVSIPRWGTFTETILEICDKDIEITEIGGNDEILVSVITTTANDSLNIGDDTLLYTSSIVSDPNLQRQVFLLPVNQLLSFVQNAKQKGIEVEHVFDY